MGYTEAKKQFYINHPEESSDIELDKIQRAKADGHIMKHISLQYIDEFETQLISNKLQYSNDTRCDAIMNNVIECLGTIEIKSALQQMFIGFIDKSNYNNASAHQRYHDGSCLVVIGRDILSDLIYLSEIITLRYIHVFNLLPSVPESLLDEWLSNLLLKRTLPLEFEISLIQNDPEDYFIGISAAILDAAMSFIIGHECGHHYHNHTNPKGDFKFPELINFDWTTKFPLLSEKHIQEFQADKFASFFTSKYIQDIRIRECIPKFHFAQEAGYIAAALQLFLDKTDPTVGSEKHPSPLDRYKSIMSSFLSDKAREMKTLVTWICEESGFADTQKWDIQWWRL